ncbi:MAG TPA: 3-phosphoshikimate 1-carboxyvinyltransferase [Chloroflexota bacterium]|nr:3-phosphoshikimate 1-carboxyvinyltransferase [Chloroflexota bacterium]
MRWRIRPSRIDGSLSVPGDKSIAHRALMLAALAGGRSEINNLPNGGDVLATAGCLRALGVDIDPAAGRVVVSSPGRLAAPERELDAANSGTTMRLLAGILVGQPFASCLTGDDSLRRRPMGRVVEPLTQMGASIRSEAGRAPLTIEPAQLRGIEYTLPVLSAQVKSAILLAGLFADGVTTVIEPAPTRDHTERMLQALGAGVSTAPVQHAGGRGAPCPEAPTTAVAGASLACPVGARRITLTPGGCLEPFRLTVPGDQSTAAFFFAAAALQGADVVIRDLDFNPTRTGFLHALRRMGASIEMRNAREELGEPVGDVAISGRAVRPIDISRDTVPLLVDEIPLLALLATQAAGESVIRGAEELRVKESDRIAGVGSLLRVMGADVEDLPDGFVIRGPTPLCGATVSSGGDHRLAMMGAVAGTIAAGETRVEGAEAAAVSFPGFLEAFAALGGDIAVA